MEPRATCRYLVGVEFSPELDPHILVVDRDRFGLRIYSFPPRVCRLSYGIELEQIQESLAA